MQDCAGFFGGDMLQGWASLGSGVQGSGFRVQGLAKTIKAFVALLQLPTAHANHARVLKRM